MSEGSELGFRIHSVRGDLERFPEAPVEHGPLRISGTVLGAGARWFVTTDRLGWSTVALVSAPPDPCPERLELEGHRIEQALQGAAAECADPIHTARRLRDVFDLRAAETGISIVRVAPFGELVELCGVGCSTTLHWDPVEGLSPYEPCDPSLAALGEDAESDILHLRAGSVLVLTTSAVLPLESSWNDLRRFVRAMAVDPLGGTLAQASPRELARLLRTSWHRGPGPAGLVVIGLPPAIRQVA